MNDVFYPHRRRKGYAQGDFCQCGTSAAGHPYAVALLGYGRKIDGLVGRQTQGRMVVLGHMVAVEASGRGDFGKLQPFRVLLGRPNIESLLDMIENTVAHQPFSPLS